MGKKNSDRQQSRIGNFWLSKRPNSDAWCITSFDARTRQTRRASTGEVDLHAAELRLAAHVTTSATMRREPAHDTPLATVLVRYYEHHAKALPSALCAKIALAKWVDFFGDCVVSDVTPARQSEFVTKLRSAGLSNGYIRRVLSTGQSALNRALKHGEIATAPHVFLNLAPEGQPRQRVLTKAEMARLFAAAAETPHLLAYLTIAVATCARKDAILDLTTFQCRDGLVFLNPPGRVQTKKHRPTVRMADELAALVARTPAGPLVTYHGVRVMSVKTAFNEARERAGLSADVIPTTIRHTMATYLYERGESRDEIEMWMGHRTGNKTTSRYIKVSPEYLTRILRATNDYFEDMKVLLAGSLSNPSYNPVRANSVRAGLSLVRKAAVQPLQILVGATRIELVTPTMST